MVRKHGDKHGIELKDIKDPRANAIMGAELYKENRATLSSSLGITPTLRHMYLAHFSGVSKAVRVIRQLERDPNVPASTVYSAKEIAANKGIFKKQGKTVTLGEAFERLTDKVVKAKGAE